MRLAIQEAVKAESFAHPNPLVGAVIVKDGKILACGYHHKFGDLHAERDALKNAKEAGLDVSGATIYVTLEPCCHTGKQPPCTQAIIEAGIKKVVIGSRDPNPLVDGKGVHILEKAGIEVCQDVLRDECDSINQVFFHYIKTKTPYVIIKYACSADGKTALANGLSFPISGEESRKNVHRTRSNVMAVMTGVSTVLKDDPMLNVRLDDGKTHRQPVRIVCDSKLQIPLDCRLVKSAKEFPLTVACLEPTDKKSFEKKSSLEKSGAKVVFVKPDADGRLDLGDLLGKLGADGIDSILVESGGRLNSSLLFHKNHDGNPFPLADEIQAYIAPKILGGSGFHSCVNGEELDDLEEALSLSEAKVEVFGSDVLLTYKVLKVFKG